MHSSAFTGTCAAAVHESFFSVLARTITDYAICRLDEQGRVRDWNPGAEKILGYSATDILGQYFPCFDVQAPGKPDRSTLHTMLRQAADNQKVECSVWCMRKDTRRFQGRVTMLAVHDAGQCQGVILTIQNLSESMSVQQALFESEQRFRILVQGVHDYAIYMLDPDGYVTNWNPGAALIKGYTEDEIVGRHFSCFYTVQDQRRGEPQRSLETALKHNTFQNEAWRVRKDGSEFWASVVIDPVFDDDHNLLGYAKVTRDITGQKRMQEQLAQQRDALHQSQKLEAVGRLTGSVAHDFNNFLAIIKTATELLESSSELTPQKRQRYTQMILDTTNRAGRLIEQLLSFARRQPLQRQVFSVAACIQEFRPIIETTLGSRRTLVLSFADDLLDIDTDLRQLETAVLNMVINARDATPEGGVITISAHNEMRDWLCPDGHVQRRAFTALAVADTGSGIDQSVLPNIFEPFYTTKDIDKGTGLGLSQVYGFVKQSGGDVVVESESGQGACFTLYLPCASPDKQSWEGILSPTAQQMFGTEP